MLCFVSFLEKILFFNDSEDGVLKIIKNQMVFQRFLFFGAHFFYMKTCKKTLFFTEFFGPPAAAPFVAEKHFQHAVLIFLFLSFVFLKIIEKQIVF